LADWIFIDVLDHLTLISGMIVADLKGEKPKGLHPIKAASMPARVIRTQATAARAAGLRGKK